MKRRDIPDMTSHYNTHDSKSALYLDDNISYYGPSPWVIKKLREMNISLNYYPDPNAIKLRKIIAKSYKIPVKRIIVGNGGDEIIDIFIKAFINPGDKLVIPSPTFSMYGYYGILNRGRVIDVPLQKETWKLRAEDVLKHEPDIVIIASPNNPTGNRIDEREILRILSNNVPVLVDEAYGEFSGYTIIPRISEYENLFVLRTLSKAYGLAGIRLGYLLGSEEKISWLWRFKPPFNVNAITLTLAEEALRDTEYLNNVVEKTRKERERLSKKLNKLGIKTYPSETNFIFCLYRDASVLVNKLKKQNIYIKKVSEEYLRITVGTRERNERLIGSISEVIEN